MSKFALVRASTNIVDDVIIINPPNVYVPAPGLFLVELANTAAVGRGFVYHPEDGSFTAPPPVVEEPDPATISEEVAEIRAKADELQTRLEDLAGRL
jgi:hypothetical protein